MHALSAYVVSFYDAKLPGTWKKKFHDLDNVRGHDLLTVVHDFTKSYGNNLKIISDGKRNRAARMNIGILDTIKRNIDGQLEYGDFGLDVPIVNVKTGVTAHPKKMMESEMRAHYFRFDLPASAKQGILLVHQIGNIGIKSVLASELREFVINKVGITGLRIEALNVDKALNKWLMTANVKQIKVRTYTGQGAIKDIADYSGGSAEVIFHPNKDEGSFGIMSDLFDGRTRSAKLLTMTSDVATDIKIVAELAGKRRTFEAQSLDFSGAIAFDENDVTMKGGMPVLSALRKFSKILADDLLGELN